MIFNESDFPTIPTGQSNSSSSSFSVHLPLDLWISNLLSGSSPSSFSDVSDALSSVSSSFPVSHQSSDVSIPSTDVSLPSSSTVTSSGPAASLSHTEISDQLPSPLPLSTSSSLPNTHPMLTKSKHGIFKPKAYAVVRNYLQEEPPTFAITSRFPHWIEAMDSEYNSLLKQQTWSLVPLPSGKNVVHCKWVYKIKSQHEAMTVLHRIESTYLFGMVQSQQCMDMETP